MTIENLNFLGEEIVLQASKIEQLTTDVFSTGTITEKDDVLARYKVIKKGDLQTKLEIGDYVLVNKNGIPKDINIEGVGTLKDMVVLPTEKRIFCKITNG